MKKFFTSDIHFDDDRLNLFGRDVVFKSSDEFDTQIIKNWNSLIKSDDIVYYLGDASLSEKGLKNFEKLNGKKILIKGNYDEADTAKFKVSNTTLSKYFYKIYKSGYIKVNGEIIYLTHFPNKGKSDCFNIVGHIHEKWKVQRNMINVGVDAWHFYPVSEKQIKFTINAIRNYYDDNVFAGELKCNSDFKYKDKDAKTIVESKKNENVLYPPKINDKNNKIIFLAGPIQGSVNWQDTAIKLLKDELPKDCKIACPRLPYKPDEFNYNKQVDWETEYLKMASSDGIILFWLANEEHHDPERCYAQTTRFELATWLERQKNNPKIKICIGIEKDFPGKKYIEKKIEDEYYDIDTIFTSLKDLCHNVISKIKK
jgi:calcineurin-like phosphoesterase family protein